MDAVTRQTLDDRTREGVGKLVDLLLPATQDLPSGRSIGAHLDLLDRVLNANPRLSTAVIEFGHRALQADTDIQIDDLEAWSDSQAEEVVFALTSAYFISPQVRAILQYPGQERRPIAEAKPDEVASEELLAPVRARGSIFVS